MEKALKKVLDFLPLVVFFIDLLVIAVNFNDVPIGYSIIFFLMAFYACFVK